MKILTVIPIAKGIPRDELSYFSARDVELGTIVTVPFGGRKIKGFVADARDVRDLKSSIKNESYALKNVLEIHHAARLPVGVFEAAQKTARFFAQKVGGVLETVVPKVLFDFYLENADTNARGPQARARDSKGTALDPGIRRDDKQNGNRGEKNTDVQIRVASDVAAIQIPFAERIGFYKTVIRENLAREKSTMIVCSTVSETEQIFEGLKLGIEDRIFCLHSKKAKNYFKKNLARIISGKDPCVVIATAPFASLSRDDWHDIIIERASSSSYRYEFGPVFDLRYFMEHQARAGGARLMFADTLLPTEIRFRILKKEIYELRSTWHIAKPEHFQIVDQKPKIPEPSSKEISKTKAKEFLDDQKPFSTLSNQAIKMISDARACGARVLLLASRKGLAPITVCSDCGTVVACPNCETPLVLHRTKQEKNAGGLRPPAPTRTYLCHHCGFQTLPTDFCAHCFGSRLATLGISTDKIRDDVLGKFPDAHVAILEREGDESISKTLETWNANGGILITTPSLLSAIESAEFGCVVSLDSLLSLPTYTSGETSLEIILQFLEKIKTRSIIQTRNADHAVMRAIASENLLDFMQEELSLREQFNYPPEKILAKISIELPASHAQDGAQYFENVFQSYDPDLMIRKSKKQNFITVTAILKIDLESWNNFSSPIHELFDTLAPEIKKEINPDSVI